MVDVRGDVLRPPHGTTPAAVKANKNQKWVHYTYSMISKNVYAEIYFSNKLFVFPIFRTYLECFQKSGFYPKILSCAEMHFLEIMSKVKSHHISESGVSFEI